MIAWAAANGSRLRFQRRETSRYESIANPIVSSFRVHPSDLMWWLHRNRCSRTFIVKEKESGAVQGGDPGIVPVATLAGPAVRIQDCSSND